MVSLGITVGQTWTSLPGTYVDPPAELSHDGSLIGLNGLHELVHLVTRAVFLRIPDRSESDLGGLDAFLQAFHLVNRQPRLSEEQIAHGDVEISLSLERTLGQKGQKAWIRMSELPSRIPKYRVAAPVSGRSARLPF